MPRCVNCKVLLPPEFLKPTSDGLALKCVFCEKNIRELRYFDEDLKLYRNVTVKEISNDYMMLLKIFSETPNIEEVISVIKNRKEIKLTPDSYLE